MFQGRKPSSELSLPWPSLITWKHIEYGRVLTRPDLQGTSANPISLDSSDDEPTPSVKIPRDVSPVKVSDDESLPAMDEKFWEGVGIKAGREKFSPFSFLSPFSASSSSGEKLKPRSSLESNENVPGGSRVKEEVTPRGTRRTPKISKRRVLPTDIVSIGSSSDDETPRAVPTKILKSEMPSPTKGDNVNSKPSLSLKGKARALQDSTNPAPVDHSDGSWDNPIHRSSKTAILVPPTLAHTSTVVHDDPVHKTLRDERPADEGLATQDEMKKPGSWGNPIARSGIPPPLIHSARQGFPITRQDPTKRSPTQPQSGSDGEPGSWGNPIPRSAPIPRVSKIIKNAEKTNEESDEGPTSLSLRKRPSPPSPNQVFDRGSPEGQVSKKARTNIDVPESFRPTWKTLNSVSPESPHATLSLVPHSLNDHTQYETSHVIETDPSEMSAVSRDLTSASSVDDNLAFPNILATPGDVEEPMISPPREPGELPMGDAERRTAEPANTPLASSHKPATPLQHHPAGGSDLVPTDEAMEQIDNSTSNKLADATPREVAQEVANVTVGLEEVDLQPGSATTDGDVKMGDDEVGDEGAAGAAGGILVIEEDVVMGEPPARPQKEAGEDKDVPEFQSVLGGLPPLEWYRQRILSKKTQPPVLSDLTPVNPHDQSGDLIQNGASGPQDRSPWSVEAKAVTQTQGITADGAHISTAPIAPQSSVTTSISKLTLAPPSSATSTSDRDTSNTILSQSIPDDAPTSSESISPPLTASQPQPLAISEVTNVIETDDMQANHHNALLNLFHDSSPLPQFKQLSIPPTSPPPGSPLMSREEWRHFVENDGVSEVDAELSILSPVIHFSRDPSAAPRHTPTDPLDPSTKTYYLSVEPVEQDVPQDRKGKAKRVADTSIHESWQRLLPVLQNQPSLHRAIFSAYITESTSKDEPEADEIKVLNDVDDEGAPQDFEFVYSNEMFYHVDVPDPEKGMGCGCEGPCNPMSKSCSCVKRQELYSYDAQMSGFAYNEDNTLKTSMLHVPIWECNDNCGCPPECMNRVIQRGRAKETKIDLFKTRHKGWGVKARVAIPKGTFVGIYSGELINEAECEKRGWLYSDIGRTYLFDCDGFHLRKVPKGLEEVDPRLAALAHATAKRAQRAAELDDSSDFCYSAYSVDAFHYGNFTRFFNHSCDPNLMIAQAYVWVSLTF
ncbi:hypothetical protein M231_05528 [Tremella mesenterica]|uniref:SET domain-containing protein n=1 Tax=Tremella mesenterica TaxID=5217 RepID=A0A4Q1BHX7_TREME|nr:hypothetical protein M231_05528 [Tremella mesenterica]